MTNKFSYKSYDQSLHNKLIFLEKNNFWFISRNNLILFLLKKFRPNFKNLLEIGCGTGFVLKMIAENFQNSNILGTEIYESVVKIAKKRLIKLKNIKIFKMDARKMKQNNKYDIVAAFDVIEHIKEEAIVLNNIYKSLKQNGLLIITVPQHKFLWSIYDEIGFHQRRYSIKYVKFILSKNKFKIDYSTSFNSFLLPIMFLSRFLNKFKNINNYDILHELKLGKTLNFLFKKILEFELFLIKRGIRIKFGGSLVIVASKKNS